MSVRVLAALASLSFSAFAGANTIQLCGKFQNQTSKSGLYNVGTDQWGDDGSGAQCVLYDPEASPEANATAYSATWSWTANINAVHSYPNVAPMSREFPIQLNNTKTFDVDVAWTMGMGNTAVASTDQADLQSNGVKANVAFDFFLDPNKTAAGNASAAAYEFMVWLAAFGGAQPLGFETTQDPQNYTLGGQNFTLYTGQNAVGQNVFSWFPLANIPSFTGDLFVLLHYVVQQGLVPSDAYLGVIQFGSETTHAVDNVTFSANPVMMELDVFVPRSGAMSRATSSTGLLVISVCSLLYLFGVL